MLFMTIDLCNAMLHDWQRKSNRRLTLLDTPLSSAQAHLLVQAWADIYPFLPLISAPHRPTLRWQ